MNTPIDPHFLDAALSALANQKRRALIHELSLHPETVGQLARDHNLSLPAIHKHIRCLEQASLIIRRKSGRTNYVVLNHAALRQTQAWIMQYHTEWANPKATLENYISRMTE